MFTIENITRMATQTQSAEPCHGAGNKVCDRKLGSRRNRNNQSWVVYWASTGLKAWRPVIGAVVCELLTESLVSCFITTFYFVFHSFFYCEYNWCLAVATPLLLCSRCSRVYNEANSIFVLRFI